MFVPDSCIPSSNLARHSTIGQQIIASKVSLRSAHTIFACYLLEQKRAKQDSKWSATCVKYLSKIACMGRFTLPSQHH